MFLFITSVGSMEETCKMVQIRTLDPVSSWILACDLVVLVMLNSVVKPGLLDEQQTIDSASEISLVILNNL